MKKSVALFASMALLSGCGPAASASKVPLMIGGILPRTGSNANPDQVAAANLAVTDMRAALDLAKNVKGFSFSITIKDDQGLATLGRSHALALAEAGAVGILADNSNASIGASMINYEGTPKNVPIVCYACTNGSINNNAKLDQKSQGGLDTAAWNAALDDKDNWFFRTTTTANGQSTLVLQKIVDVGDKNGDGTFKVAIVGTNDANGASFSSNKDRLIAALTAAGKPTNNFVLETLVMPQSPGTGLDNQPGAYDFRTHVIDRLFDGLLQSDTVDSAGKVVEDPAGVADGKAPDVVWVGALPVQAVTMIQSYAKSSHHTASGYEAPLIVSDPLHRNTALATLGNDGIGIQGVSFLSWVENESGNTFKAEQTAITGWEPTSAEANAYDGASLLMLAAIKAGSALPDPSKVTAAQVRDALTQLQDPAGTLIGAGPASLAKGIDLLEAGKPINYDGASGPVDFDMVGNVNGFAEYYIVQAVNGAPSFVAQKVYSCDNTTCTAQQ
jgi:hypothetical protein